MHQFNNLNIAISQYVTRLLDAKRAASSRGRVLSLEDAVDAGTLREWYGATTNKISGLHAQSERLIKKGRADEQLLRETLDVIARRFHSGGALKRLVVKTSVLRRRVTEEGHALSKTLREVKRLEWQVCVACAVLEVLGARAAALASGVVDADVTELKFLAADPDIQLHHLTSSNGLSIVRDACVSYGVQSGFCLDADAKRALVRGLGRQATAIAHGASAALKYIDLFAPSL